MVGYSSFPKESKDINPCAILLLIISAVLLAARERRSVPRRVRPRSLGAPEKQANLNPGGGSIVQETICIEANRSTARLEYIAFLGLRVRLPPSSARWTV